MWNQREASEGFSLAFVRLSLVHLVLRYFLGLSDRFSARDSAYRLLLAGYLSSLFFDPDDGGNTFLRTSTRL
jgi:hypothetical protein